MNNIPPEIMALLEEISSGTNAMDNNDLLGAQYKTADQMRKTQMPQAQMYGANHVAPINPMEQAAAAIQQYRGGQGQRDAMDQMKANLGTVKQSELAAMVARALRDYPTQNPQMPKPVQPPPAMAFGGDPSGSYPGP